MTIPRCDLQDYLEIACMFQYDVRVKLTTDEVLQGVAKDVFSKQGKEWLTLLVESNVQQIETAELVSLEVLTPGARFTHVSFD